MRKYVTVNTQTIKGLKHAEWYKAHGWIIVSIGFYTIQFLSPSPKAPPQPAARL